MSEIGGPIAAWIAERAVEDVEASGALEGVTDPDEQERIIKRAVDYYFNRLGSLFDRYKRTCPRPEKAVDDRPDLVLPPLKPISKVDQAQPLAGVDPYRG